MQPIKHVYSFFDFQPFVPDSVSFEPCFMLPEGDDCACLELGCIVDSTDGRRQQEQRKQAAVTEDVTFDVQGSEGAPCPTPPGYMTRDRSAGIVAGACAQPLLPDVPLCAVHTLCIAHIASKRWQTPSGIRTTR